jgi:F-type H+-transporting ATPase subunit epsilon
VTEFPLVILTPDREWFNGPAECVTAPGQAGEFGVMAKHIRLVSGLKPGVLKVRAAAGRQLHFAVDGGILGVDDRGVRILTGRVAPADSPAAAAKFIADWNREG